MLSSFTSNIEEEYDIEEKELARGAYGYVQKAKLKSDEKVQVAIKTLIDDAITFEASKSLLRELQLLATIKHPKCLRLVGFTLSPVPKIITPFMSHGSLDDVLKKIAANKPDPNFTPTKMMCSVYGICSTMQFLHDKSIIHRDFKPLNVFLDDKYDICIADFGLSRKVQENINMTMNNIGTPLYIAPELFNDEYETYTNKIDVYSFGASYYQYFAKLENLDDKKGKIKSPQNLMMRIARGARFVHPPGMNDEQFEVYKRCTNENPNERPSFADLCEYFEKEKNSWFEGVNEAEYLAYIEDCKEIYKKAMEKEKKKKEEEPNVSTSSMGSSSSLSSSFNKSKRGKRY